MSKILKTKMFYVWTYCKIFMNICLITIVKPFTGNTAKL